MAFNFSITDFENLNKIGQEWPTSEGEREPYKKNLDKLKKLRDAINEASTDYYAVSNQNPNGQSGRGKFTVGGPFLNVFPKWMPDGLKVNEYEIGFIIEQNAKGFDFNIAFCIKHYEAKKMQAPKSIPCYHWDAETIENINETDLVKEIIEKCDANIDKLVEEGVKNNVSVCIAYQNGTLQDESTERSGTNANNKNTPPVTYTHTIPLNQILYGPPGTGKTYNTVNKALDIIQPTWHVDFEKQKNTGETDERIYAQQLFNKYKGKKQIVFTTFHQSMSYEDFVEGIKPEDDNGNIKYSVKPGIFKRLCEEAGQKANKDKKYVLIIDEINRGNVSQIFGELITLLEEDKRIVVNKPKKGDEFELRVRLPYSDAKDPDFGIPSNIYIIGTMNTADRSVEALDTALRRRFSFVEMMPNSELLKDRDGNYIEVCGFKLSDLLDTLNKRIIALKDREHQIGHSYFMGCPNDANKAEEWLKSVFKDKIIPLLQEYFYGDYKKIYYVLGPGFVEKKTEKTFFAVEDSEYNEFDIPNERYDIVPFDNKFSIVEAIKSLKVQSKTRTDE